MQAWCAEYNCPDCTVKAHWHIKYGYVLSSYELKDTNYFHGKWYEMNTKHQIINQEPKFLIILHFDILGDICEQQQNPMVIQ